MIGGEREIGLSLSPAPCAVVLVIALLMAVAVEMAIGWRRRMRSRFLNKGNCLFGAIIN